MQCPKCGSKERVKSGFMNGKQRYKCKSCKCNFTQSNQRGASQENKRGEKKATDGQTKEKTDNLLNPSARA